VSAASHARRPESAGVAPPAATLQPAERLLRRLLLGTALFLGLAQAWASRHAMISDGASYLDIADAIAAGNWSAAANAYWSPLYPWLLAAALAALRPAPYWEFAVVHLVNFAIYLGALAAFDFLWRGLLASRLDSDAERHLPGWAWVGTGYLLFLFTSLNMINLGLATPDLLVAALVYLACGLTVRIRSGRAGWGWHLLLGLALGLGYLAKTPMFLLAFVFLGVLLLDARSVREGRAQGRYAPRIALSLLVFLVVSGPFVTALSRAKGRLTIGDSGRLNYAWWVNGVTPFIHWQGGPSGSGAPLHPTRKILDSPPVYEFASPVAGAYPPWTDPSYWYEGVRPHFNWRGQLRVLRQNGKLYYDIFLYLDSLIVGLGTLLWLQGDRFSGLARQRVLLVPSLAAMAMYCLVAGTGRYLAPFVLVFWMGVLAATRLPEDPGARRIATGLLGAVLTVLAIRMCGSSAEYLLSAARSLAQGEQPGVHPSWAVADGLRQLGVRPGDTVGVIAHPFVHGPYEHPWARLARVRIIAELPSRESENFLPSPEAVKKRVLEAFASTGVTAVVAYRPAAYGATPGWHRIGETDYFAYQFRR